ncbi:HAD-IA family hydrolase [Candidatus Woesebacteria bacterium]|nr:HAD-IA family hydrolase [Candidatus Woesebacteria bacterium]
MISLEDYLVDHPKTRLIFDFDETLFTLLLPWETYLTEFSQKLLTAEPSLRSYNSGKMLNETENEAVRRFGDKIVQLRREYARYFEKTFYKGALEHKKITSFIRENHTKYRMAIWTSNMRETILPILEENNLADYFEIIVTRSEVRLTKPEPEGFFMIHEALGGNRAEYMLVGDSKNDENAARASEIDFYCVKETVS